VDAESIQTPYRSRFQEAIAAELTARGVAFTAGTHVIEYTRPQRLAKYTPSFFLTDSGIILQAKGRFVTADRQKHILIKMQQPDLDIRFIFYDARQRISAKSDTTYADWCVRYGFTYTCRNANLKAGLPIVPIPLT
jgi:hypothetical protein